LIARSIGQASDAVAGDSVAKPSGRATIQILVDGDACPVKAEVEKVAARHGLAVTIVSNGGLRPSANPLLRHVTVAEGADAADDWIVDNIAAGDICITADIPLAARCLDKGARVLGPNGKAFTQDGIGMALGMRELSRHLRELTAGGQTHHAGFSKQDRSRFLGELENCIVALKRAV
jgi:uncharacterized protein YaiI (UPF0178 family)